MNIRHEHIGPITPSSFVRGAAAPALPPLRWRQAPITSRHCHFETCIGPVEPSRRSVTPMSRSETWRCPAAADL